MKRKLYKGLGMLVMAGFLVTAVGSNVHATENQFNENTENSSQQNENKSEEKNTDTGNDDTDKKGSGMMILIKRALIQTTQNL